MKAIYKGSEVFQISSRCRIIVKKGEVVEIFKEDYQAESEYVNILVDIGKRKEIDSGLYKAIKEFYWLQEKRIKYRPGLVPPYYADLPETLEEIQDSELRYLESFEKRPLRTQWRYFWKAFVNIVFKKARSA